MDGLNASTESASTRLSEMQLEAHPSVKRQKRAQVGQVEIGAIGMRHIGERTHRYVRIYPGVR